MTSVELTTRALCRLSTWTRARVSASGSDRGDVPGWVLIVLMTAGLVTVLWSLAGSTLETVFTDAIASVVGSGGAG